MAFTAVVGYDGRPGARAALDLALGLAERLHGRLILAYLVDAPHEAVVSEESRAEGEELIRGALMAAGNHDVRAEALVTEGPVAEGLLAIAHEHCADLLFVGTSGESAIVAAILGSACHKLVHRTTVPLVVVPAAKPNGA